MMKIAVASDDGKNIAGHFGRCKLFVVFEIEGKKIKNKEIRKNDFTAHASGECSHSEEHRPGAGEHSHIPILKNLSDCQVVISQGMGWALRRDLTASEIASIITQEKDAETAVKKYLQGELKSFDEITCGCH